jgi:hypothetical protein
MHIMMCLDSEPPTFRALALPPEALRLVSITIISLGHHQQYYVSSLRPFLMILFFTCSPKCYVGSNKKIDVLHFVVVACRSYIYLD